MSAVKTLVGMEGKTLVDHEVFDDGFFDKEYDRYMEDHPYEDFDVDEKSIIENVDDSLELVKKRLIVVKDSDTCNDIMEKIQSISGDDSNIQETEGAIHLLEIALCNINTYLDENQDVADEKKATEKAKEWIDRFQKKLEEANDLLSQQKEQSDYLWGELTKRTKLLDDVSSE
jgi:hypothetical protein